MDTRQNKAIQSECYQKVEKIWKSENQKSFQETINFNKLIDINTPVFPLILKFFLKIFLFL